MRNESPLCAKRSPQVRKDFPPKITCAQRALLLHAKSFPPSASPRSYLSPLRKNLKTGTFFKTRKFRYLTLSMKKSNSRNESFPLRAGGGKAAAQEQRMLHASRASGVTWHRAA